MDHERNYLRRLILLIDEVSLKGVAQLIVLFNRLGMNAFFFSYNSLVNDVDCGKFSFSLADFLTKIKVV